MYQRAKYFSNKFIRNGLSGFAISGLLLLFTKGIDPQSLPLVCFFLLISLLWLLLGLKFNKKLKSKTDDFEIENLSYKWIDLVLSFLIMMVLVLSLQHSAYLNLIAIPIILAYSFWFFKQVKLLNNYFKAN